MEHSLIVPHNKRVFHWGKSGLREFCCLEWACFGTKALINGALVAARRTFAVLAVLALAGCASTPQRSNTLALNWEAQSKSSAATAMPAPIPAPAAKPAPALRSRQKI